jgi:hypothetical protein
MRSPLNPLSEEDFDELAPLIKATLYAQVFGEALNVADPPYPP